MTLNLKDKKIGRLTPLYYTGKTYKKKRIWKCVCDCGNYTEVRADVLNKNRTLSCGCLRIETIKGNPLCHHPRRNLVGEKFGRLEVKGLVLPDPIKHSYRKWRCLCDCGNYIETHQTSLIYGRTKSCGCLRKEKSSQRLIQYNDSQKIY